MSLLMKRCTVQSFLAICFLLSMGARAQTLPDRTDYEEILVPLFITYQSGAYGSTWFSDLYAFNANAAPVEVYWQTCSVITPCQRTFLLQPSRTSYVPAIRTESHRQWGILLWVPKAASPGIFFHGRIMDLSRSAQNYGTEIPIVRESKFLTGRAHLIKVPLDARFRQSLRIYDTDNLDPPAEFRVRFFSDAGVLLADTVLTAVPGDVLEELPRYAPAAFMHDFRTNVPQLEGHDFVRLEIEPLRQGNRFWAFVSITNNDTQLVTTITPQ